MQIVRLEGETDFDGWRAAARRLRLAEVTPEQVVWTVGGLELPTRGRVLLGGAPVTGGDRHRHRAG